jgi:hypothetical protein
MSVHSVTHSSLVDIFQIQQYFDNHRRLKEKNSKIIELSITNSCKAFTGT